MVARSDEMDPVMLSGTTVAQRAAYRLREASASASFSDLANQRPWFIIDPRSSKYIMYWDVTMGIAICFTATVTPYEVALLPSPKSFDDPLFLINRFIDVGFTVDMVLQFLLAYTDDDVRWEVRPRRIARRYLLGWFFIDLASLSISMIDVVNVAAATGDGRAGEQGQQGQQTSFNPARFKVLRVMRVLRLLKLARILRSSRIFRRWEMRTMIDYGKVTMARCLVQILAMTHFMSCTWAMQALWSTEPEVTWLASLDETNSCPTSSTEVWPDCLDRSLLYLTSVYWSIMTITSIGYGDISANKSNWVEMSAACVLMLMSAFMWGNVVAVFVGEMTAFNTEGHLFRKTMDDLNHLMREHALPDDMRRRLREYFHREPPRARPPRRTRARRSRAQRTPLPYPCLLAPSAAPQARATCARHATRSCYCIPCRPRCKARSHGQLTRSGSHTSTFSTVRRVRCS